jgi:hypothetical protein
MGIIKKFMEKWAKRKERAWLKEFANTFDSIGKLFESRLLVFDAKMHQLYIHNTLADVMLAKGEAGWRAFLNNVFLSLAYQQMSGNWEAYFQQQEKKAVAEAWEKQGDLSTADVERIKRAARAKVKKDNMGRTMPMEFEFVIIYDRGETADIVAVGRYNAETEELEMEEWQWVKNMVEQNNKRPTYGNTIRTK